MSTFKILGKINVANASSKSNYYVNDFIKFIGMSRINFFKVLEKYTNKKIWNKKNYKSLKDFKSI